MKFHIVTDSGTRLLNNEFNWELVPFDSLAYKECRAVLIVRAGTGVGTVLSALKEIEEYVKKDL